MWRGSDIPRCPVWPFVVGLIVAVAMLSAAMVGCTVHLVTVQLPGGEGRKPAAKSAGDATTQPARRSFVERLLDDM